MCQQEQLDMTSLCIHDNNDILQDEDENNNRDDDDENNNAKTQYTIILDKINNMGVRLDTIMSVVQSDLSHYKKLSHIISDYNVLCCRPVKGENGENKINTIQDTMVQSHKKQMDYIMDSVIGCIRQINSGLMEGQEHIEAMNDLLSVSPPLPETYRFVNTLKRWNQRIQKMSEYIHTNMSHLDHTVYQSE